MNIHLTRTSNTALVRDHAAILQEGLRSLSVEAAGLERLSSALANELASAFCATVEQILQARGRVIVSGMGKSGHIGRKIAATLASTGTPAFFVHPAEASHGDLGMVTPDDVILALSWSGETNELGDLIHFSRRFAVRLVAITSRAESTLGKAADITLALPRVEEACPHGLAPTTSTILQLALGDAIAMALIAGRGFQASNFREFHPGGKLGARLLKVEDLMHVGDEVPLVAEGLPMADAIIAITSRRFGCTGVTAADGALSGVVTDGDLRRNMVGLLERTTETVMSRAPLTVSPDALASSALEVMNRERITALFVVADGKPVGIIHIHDLLRAGVA